MSKGSKRRPSAVDRQTFEENWELAFRKGQVRVGVDLATGPDHSAETPVFIGLVTAEDRKTPEDTQ